MSNELITQNVSAFDEEAEEINVRMSKSINMADSATKIAGGVREKISSQAYVDDAGVQWSFERWWNEKITCGVSYDAMQKRLERAEGPAKVVADRRADPLTGAGNRHKPKSTPKDQVNTDTVGIHPQPDVQSKSAKDLGIKEEAIPDRPHVKRHAAAWFDFTDEERAYLFNLYKQPLMRFN